MKVAVFWTLAVCVGILYAIEIGYDVFEVTYSIVGIIVTGYLLNCK